MSVQPIIIQRRYRELGRIRLGEKGAKGQPVRRDTFRMTSPARPLLERAADLWGGEVQEWKDAPTEGKQWELATTTAELPVLVPPQDIDSSQYFEQWTAGGVKRRCDGVTELISGRECKCDPDARQCQITTHLQVMLPQLPDVGVWRLTVHGFNAAAELPGTVHLLDQIRQAGQMPGAVLAIESRTSKQEGQTRHFIVPVLRLPQSMLELGAAVESGGIPMLTQSTVDRAALPAGVELPEDPSFDSDDDEAVPVEALPPSTPPPVRADGPGPWDEIAAHIESGAIATGQVLVIARRVCKDAGVAQPTAIEKVERLSDVVLEDVVQAVAEKIAEKEEVAS